MTLFALIFKWMTKFRKCLLVTDNASQFIFKVVHYYIPLFSLFPLKLPNQKPSSRKWNQRIRNILQQLVKQFFKPGQSCGHRKQAELDTHNLALNSKWKMCFYPLPFFPPLLLKLICCELRREDSHTQVLLVVSVPTTHCWVQCF